MYFKHFIDASTCPTLLFCEFMYNCCVDILHLALFFNQVTSDFVRLLIGYCRRFDFVLLTFCCDTFQEWLYIALFVSLIGCSSCFVFIWVRITILLGFFRKRVLFLRLVGRRLRLASPLPPGFDLRDYFLPRFLPSGTTAVRISRGALWLVLVDDCRFECILLPCDRSQWQKLRDCVEMTSLTPFHCASLLVDVTPSSCRSKLTL